MIFWLGNGLVKLNSQRKIIEKEIKTSEGKISEVQKNKDELNNFLKNFENPAFLEREARLKLNYKHQDEQVAFVYRETSKPVSQSFENNSNPIPIYKKWWRYLFGY